MQNKPANRWLDVQIVIATLAMAASLFLWNLFAGGSRSVNSGTASNVQGASASSPVSSQPLTRILLGGAAPQVRQQAASVSNAPAPVTVTSSSRP